MMMTDVGDDDNEEEELQRALLLSLSLSEPARPQGASTSAAVTADAVDANEISLGIALDKKVAEKDAMSVLANELFRAYGGTHSEVDISLIRCLLESNEMYEGEGNATVTNSACMITPPLIQDLDELSGMHTHTVFYSEAKAKAKPTKSNAKSKKGERKERGERKGNAKSKNHSMAVINMCRGREVIVFIDSSGESAAAAAALISIMSAATVLSPPPAVQVQAVWKPERYGLYHYIYRQECGTATNNPSTSHPSEGHIMVHSNASRLAALIDEGFDAFFWGWNFDVNRKSECWSSRLENAVVRLVIAVDDDLRRLVTNMTSMMPGMVDDLNNMLTIIELDLQNAMNESKPSKLAIGRLHMTLFQFLQEGSSMSMMFPPSFMQAASEFQAAKMACTPTGTMRKILKRLEQFLCSYIDERDVCNRDADAYPDQQALSRLSQALQTLHEMMQTKKSPSVEARRNTIDFTLCSQLFSQLRPGALELMTQNQANPNSQVVPMNALSYMPTIPTPASSFTGTYIQTIDRLTETWVETLSGDSLTIGSMLGWNMQNQPLGRSAKLLLVLLNAGYGYSANTGKLYGQLSSQRAVLYLDDPSSYLHRKLRKRRSDARRLVRKHYRAITSTASKDSQESAASLAQTENANEDLQFRINSDFDLAVAKLREHHGEECWVDLAMEAVWKEMHARKQLFTFELWCGDKMIAADIGHPTAGGRYMYIATRFYDRSYSIIAPGFILAIVETAFLKANGLVAWDLGGVDGCPLMQYKYDVAQAHPRYNAMLHFNKTRWQSTHINSSLPVPENGIVIPRITDMHLS